MDPRLVSDIRDALAHLYDHAYLETHPLAEIIAANQAGIARTRAQETRRVLLDAIELLNPGDNTPLRAPERRAYEVLFGLYVEGREPHDVADSLGIGERQLRRDRSTALEALATILQDRYTLVREQSTAPSPVDMITVEPPIAAESMRVESLGRESQRLANQCETVDLADFFDKLLPLLSGLAQQHRVELVVDISPALPPLPLSYSLLRQIILSLASQSIYSLPIAQMIFRAQVSPQRAGIGIDLIYLPGQALQLEKVEREIMEGGTFGPMVAAMDGKIQWEMHSVDHHRLWLFLPRWQRLNVLVVDDKQDLFELFLRYLTGHPYQLRHATGVDQGLQMVHEAPPDIILLDLMMPERDGWEFLLALHTEPGLTPIPVIVCSVLHEPELAFSLGAQHYLKKPITADALVEALELVRQRVWEMGMHPAAPAPSQ